MSEVELVRRRIQMDWDPGTHREGYGLVGVHGGVALLVAIADTPVPRDVTHLYPMALDIGVHARERPEWADPRGMSDADDCWLLGGRCWYDGSSLAAVRYMRVLLGEGEDALWRALRGYYSASYEPSPGPVDPPRPANHHPVA